MGKKTAKKKNGKADVTAISDETMAELQQLAVSQLQMEGALKACEMMKARLEADVQEYADGIRKCEDRTRFLSPSSFDAA
jgi:hypothetical protein